MGGRGEEGEGGLGDGGGSCWGYVWWLVVGVGDGVEFVIRGWVGDTNRFVLIVCVFLMFYCVFGCFWTSPPDLLFE